MITETETDVVTPSRSRNDVDAHARRVSHLLRLLREPSSPRLRSPEQAYVANHPLDPLVAEEVRATTQACKTYALRLGRGVDLRFNSISMKEPAKAALLAYDKDPQRAARPPRQAACVLQLPGCTTVIEATVSLDVHPPTVTSWTELEGVQPMVTVEDCIEAEQIVKEDATVQRHLRERYGITDMDYVAADPWYYGGRFAKDSDPDGRFIQCFMYLRNADLNDNHYAHPLDIMVNVNMTTKSTAGIWMHDKAPQIPMMNSNFHSSLVTGERPLRTGLRPLHVVQPEGPSFEVRGQHLTWQKWRMRVGFNFREGLVLHNIGYEDGGRVRPVMHRASLVEIIVPYGDPRAPFHRKCAFDVVDYGLGLSANSLELGCDCLGHIQYFDAVLNDKRGDPMIVKKAVCVHEEDAGMLWKHVEYRNMHAEVRRSRRLVLSFIATIANYEYGFYWYFYQDGTIAYEVKLTGCLSTNGLSPGEGPLPSHGVLVAPGLNSQIHQHFFCARLDMAVDDPNGGRNLTVSEVNVEPMASGPDNPYHVGFTATETEFQTERQAQRNAAPQQSRIWKIKNKNVRNPITGYPVGFKLMPHASPPLYAQAASEHARRGAFATRHLWVTPHSDDEMWPAGVYPLQDSGSHHARGIADWTQQDRPIANADVVVWHTFGVTHIPRIEDYPVMPCEYVGFTLKPVNFFDANPGLDIVPGRNPTSRQHHPVHHTLSELGPNRNSDTKEHHIQAEAEAAHVTGSSRYPHSPRAAAAATANSGSGSGSGSGNGMSTTLQLASSSGSGGSCCRMQAPPATPRTPEARPGRVLPASRL